MGTPQSPGPLDLILDAEDMEMFEQLELISPPMNGSRSVNKRALMASSSDIAYVAATPDQPRHDTAVATIPNERFSEATYVYIGLHPLAARECWRRWTSSPPGARDFEGGPNDFLSFAFEYVQAADQDACSANDDWRRAMRSMGASEELVDGILNPELDDIRLKRSARGWILETFDLRWGILEGLSRISKERIADYKGKRRMAEQKRIVEAAQDCDMADAGPVSMGVQ